MRKVGDYVVTETSLGKGNFAEVFLGHEYGNSDNKFAVKVIPKKNFDVKNKKLLLRETELLEGLKHENIISLITVNETANNIYLIIDYCSNGKIFDYIKAKKLEKTPELILNFTRELFSGFRYLYNNNIIHRDIKPDNLLIDASGRLKIADFGFWRVVDDLEKKFNPYALGCPSYTCYEVISQRPYSSKCDVYSSAVVIFELAYGFHPLFPDLKLQPKSIGDLFKRFKYSKE